MLLLCSHKRELYPLFALHKVYQSVDETLVSFLMLGLLLWELNDIQETTSTGWFASCSAKASRLLHPSALLLRCRRPCSITRRFRYNLEIIARHSAAQCLSRVVVQHQQEAVSVPNCQVVAAEATVP